MLSENDSALFATTRGKVLLLLCRGPQTVNELMAALGVTDNAVRAQLANLQESGLVCQVGLRPGARKPHVEYELTPQARRLFPKAHEQALGALVAAIHDQLPADKAAALLSDAARRVLGTWVSSLHQPEPRLRFAELYEKISNVTNAVSLEEQDDRSILRSCGCPLASVTSTHPEICAVLAAVLSDVLGAPVRERCDRTDVPRCCFELGTTTSKG